VRDELPRRAPRGLTRERPLPGALQPAERAALLTEIGVKLGERQALRLWRIYGKNAADVAAMAMRPELAERLDGDVLTAELVYALSNECATTLDDLLQRRCMAGLDADFGLRTAPAAAAALTRLGVWDASRAAHELAEYRELAERHTARVNATRRRAAPA
jgi:glycerol-3-phosphate dehydrogenase